MEKRIRNNIQTKAQPKNWCTKARNKRMIRQRGCLNSNTPDYGELNKTLESIGLQMIHQMRDKDGIIKYEKEQIAEFVEKYYTKLCFSDIPELDTNKNEKIVNVGSKNCLKLPKMRSKRL